MYKADVTPPAAMDRLSRSVSARLIDVRTAEEWEDVGLPCVDGLLAIEWLTMPMGELNPNFLGEVERAGVSKDDELYILCRTGPRSIAAAQALAAAGYTRVYNVLEGYEGDADVDGYRGKVSGWQYHGLPWRRDEQRTAA
ncbi:MAG: rhodanese-like domain-containing protein [Rhizobiales bacterium]|nr:rhodanese-like domain-containing protein [Hyphomicrobiales bacterium]